ncbi:putative ascorbate peroxidase [Watersipora subatra]|uniref:putative ascorbate peroxidase n=1 Tax=Watersipora subatra TaxID=2589382 RepID=UPI00355AE22A
MRMYKLMMCLLLPLIVYVHCQSATTRARPRNGSGWADSAAVQAALRDIGTNGFDLDKLLSALDSDTTTASSASTQAPFPVTRPTRKDRPTTRPPRRSTTRSVLQTTATQSPGTAQPLTAQRLEAMKDEFEVLFIDVPKIAKYVQMGFHMCVGPAGCDGCLNVADPGNSGLIPHYNELRANHQRWKDFISLADYGALAGLMAVKAGVERDNSGCNQDRCTFDFIFTSGRVTCDNPDDPPQPAFPLGQDIHSPQGLVDDFGLTQEEMVALMGCHSVGQNHADVTGFDGPWDLSPTVLNNGYFQAMTRVRFSQVFQPKAGATQWVGTTSSGTNLTMLHADMILQHQFTVSGSRNEASCQESRGCPLAVTTSTFVDRFATDNMAFLRVLRRAITKMSNTATFDPQRRQVFN